MRTKTLLLTAALSAAGMATSMAQVYSVNAVGYVNTTIKPGLNLVSNPLVASNNSIAALFAGVPNGTQVYVFSGNAYTTYSYVNQIVGWQPASASTVTTLPGDGVFVRNAGTTDFTLTFVGEVPQGTASNTTVPAGLSIKSSAVPQSGLVSSDLGYPIANGDQVYKYNTAKGGYDTFNYINNIVKWTPSEPTLGVGEAIFVRKNASANWDRNFNVNS